MQEIKKIDVHAHATSYAKIEQNLQIFGQQALSVEEEIALHERLNIQTCVLLPITLPRGQGLQITNEDCSSIAQINPERFLWFCNIDPRVDGNDSVTDLSKILEHYKELGAKGVGEITTSLYADHPKMEKLFYYCAQADMPALIHISPSFEGAYGIVDELGLPRIEKQLKKYPNLKLIGHSQPFWAEISADVTQATRNDYPKGKVQEGRVAKLMREYGNLYCDISAGSGANALMRDREYTARFFEEFSDRILYGCDCCSLDSDYPFALDKFLDEMVADGYLTLANYKKIVRENAIKLLKLDV